MTIAVVGGGITGLSLAYDLCMKGQTVHLYEQEEFLGGLAGCFPAGDTWLEKYYHHLFTSDTHIVQLIDELGLKEKLEWSPSSVGFYYLNKSYRFTTPLDLLRFKPLSLTDRIKLGLAIFRLRKLEDWKPLEKITAVEFIKKEMGENVYKVVWEPLLRSKFGNKYEDVAAVWFWGKIKLRGSTRKKGREQLGYIKGGFQTFIDEIAKRIKQKGGQILTGTPVSRIKKSESGNWIVNSRQGANNYKQVAVTSALPVYLDIVSDLPDDYRKKLASIPYQGSVCLVVKLDRSLSSVYWLNVTDLSIPFVAVIEHTNFKAPDIYGGHYIYLSRYLDREDELFKMNADQLKDAFIPNLKKVFPKFDPNWIKDCHLWKDSYTQPVIGLNFSELVPDYKTPLPGLYLATMAQIYPEDRGTNYAVKEGRKAAGIILEDIK